MTAQQERKRIIRGFMREHYTDERLAMTLAHARDGKMSYYTCCCLVGLATPEIPHALQGRLVGMYTHENAPSDIIVHIRLRDALCLPCTGADLAYRELTHNDHLEGEAIRRRILIPIIRCEMRRRSHLRQFEELPDSISHANPNLVKV
jgi:hypothetical protein